MEEKIYQYGPHELTEDQARLVQGLHDDARNRFEAGDQGALDHSVASKPNDPAFILLLDGKTSTPVVHRDGCYICEDPEFAAMGLPLCFKCPACVRKEKCGACQGAGGLPDSTACTDCMGTGRVGSLGHIAADDDTCDECGYAHSPLDYGDKGEILPEPKEEP
jgi:hypothetical protein